MKRWMGALFLTAGCSLGVPQPDACQSSDECRSLFGAGTYCSEETSRCESVLNARCPELFPADIADARDAILFGSILDRDSENQRVRERAIQQAVRAIDERNGIDGRRVGVLHCDVGERATDASTFLVEDVGVPAIVGPSSSSDVEAVFRSHVSDGVLVMSPSATAVTLDAIDIVDDGPGLLWRTAPPDNLQAAVMVSRLSDAGGDPTPVVILHRTDDTYAEGLALALNDAGGLDATLRSFTETEQIASAAADAVAADPSPEAVVFISSRITDSASFLNAAGEISAYDGVRIVMPDGAASEELLTLTASESGAMRYPQVELSRPATPDTPVTDLFVGDYRATHEDENPLAYSFTAHAYDAMALLILGAGYAVDQEEGLSGTTIARGLLQLFGGAEEQRLVGSNFNVIIGAIRGGQTVNVLGASGPLDYDGNEELSSATYDILSISGVGPGAELSVVTTLDAP